MKGVSCGPSASRPSLAPQYWSLLNLLANAETMRSGYAVFCVSGDGHASTQDTRTGLAL